jgi:hypothetical protein
MAALTQARQWYRQLNEPLHAAAVQQHLESTTNSTFGSVSVVIGVPKGGVAQSPRNTKVLLYMHGERKVLACTRGRGACPVHCLTAATVAVPWTQRAFEQELNALMVSARQSAACCDRLFSLHNARRLLQLIWLPNEQCAQHHKTKELSPAVWITREAVRRVRGNPTHHALQAQVHVPRVEST